MRHRYRDKDTIGKIGADSFRKWAGAVGLVVNDSGDDRAGWDFVVESHPDAGNTPPSSPFGHTDSFPLRARVQVKATDKRSGAVDIKLSNWVRLVESPDPAFIFVAELDGEDAPQRAWFVHVGEEDWREVERRKWVNEVSRGKKAHRPMHKLHRLLRYDAHDPLPSLDGQALVNAFDAAVGPNLSAYVARKAKAVQSLGFEEGNIQLVLQMKGGMHPSVTFADAQLGLLTSVPFETARIAPIRFGIVHEGAVKESGPGEIRVPKTYMRGPVEVVVESTGLDRAARIAAEMRVPPALAERARQGEIPDGHAIHVTSEYMQVVVRSGAGSTFNLKSPEPADPAPLQLIHELTTATAIFAAANRERAELVIRVIVQDGTELLLRKEAPSSEDADAVLSEMPPDWVFDLLDNVWRLARAFEAEHRIVVSLNELAQVAESVAFALALAAGPDTPAEFAFEWSPPEVAGGGEAGVGDLLDVSRDVILAASLVVGTQRLSYSAHLCGALTREAGEDRYSVSFQSTDHRFLRVTRVNEPAPDLSELASKSLRSLGRQALIIVYADTEDDTP